MEDFFSVQKEKLDYEGKAFYDIGDLVKLTEGRDCDAFVWFVWSVLEVVAGKFFWESTNR